MKRMCLGTLLKIIYWTRENNVTNKKICDAVFGVYGLSTSMFDSSHISHLKSGTDNPSPDLIDAARILEPNAACEKYNDLIKLIKKENQIAVIKCIKGVLKEDTSIGDETEVGYNNTYTKEKIIKSNTFNLAALLANAFYYSIVCVNNKECVSEIRALTDEEMDCISQSNDNIFIEERVPVENTKLAISSSEGFDKVFDKVNSTIISGLANPTALSVYQTNVTNCTIKFRDLSGYLTDNIANYVYSRSYINTARKCGKEAGTGIKAFKAFRKAYGTSADTVLGEILLYIFLENCLKAPKIMSKIETSISMHGSVGNSEGVHLLTFNDSGVPFNQLVFGTSDIKGSLKTAVDRVFDKISAIRDGEDDEIEIVENVSFNAILDEETTNYVKSIILPSKGNVSKPDMAFGAFLGYTIDVDSDCDNNEYRSRIQNQLKNDSLNIQEYIAEIIKKNNMSGYCFYFYIIPFNDADNEKNSIIEAILE